MAPSTFALVRTLHVLAAAITLGSLVTLPFLRPRLQQAGDSRWAAAGLEVIAQVERMLVVPGALGLLVFGLLLVEGPVAQWSFTAPGAGFLHIGTSLWMLLAASVLVMLYHRRRLQERAQAGATGGKEVATLWRRWTLGAVGGALVVLAGVAVMTLRLG